MGSTNAFYHHKKIERTVDSKHNNQVYTTIIDYSGKGLVQKKAEILWRVAGQKEWKHIALKQTDAVDHFYAEIPFHKPGSTIEYYISAVSKSRKSETEPRTAPSGTYKFSIQ